MIKYHGLMLNEKSFCRILLLFTGIMTLASACRDGSPTNPSGTSASLVEERTDQMPVFPYGGVYFRKSNPPAEDWEKDYQTAAGLGANVFRHWFLWSSIEVGPGRYDWNDYDRQMELSERNGIGTVIGEISNFAPEWMFEQYPDGRVVNRDNTVLYPMMNASSATGGAAMCLDNEDVLLEAERFQTALIDRYRNHPALLAYDLWNEMHPAECYCEATLGKFREWLKKKYGSLEALRKAWHRYSISDWEQVQPPRRHMGAFPDAMDWVEFRRDNKHRLLQRRIELFRRLDGEHPVTGHSAFVARATSMPEVAYDDWRDATGFDVFGFTYVASRNGNEPWMQFQAVDFVRAASRGKPFWHAEAEAGSLWMQPQVTGRARGDGRISDALDVRVWNQVSMACGATGILYPRWRPLLDGPLWGAFGPMNMDGSAGPKAEMAGKVARWANAHPELWRSQPVKGDIGIVWVPETSVFDQVQLGQAQQYAESVRGAYQVFFDQNIQADFVHIDHIHEYPLVYLPYPVMLKAETAQKLLNYVENGGHLICEGLPGYFGDGGHVGEVQPNLGLDRLFGVREKYVEFTPDLLEDLIFHVMGHELYGRYFRQEYTAEGGVVAGRYAGGAAAAVEHRYGQGKTLLIGTFPGAGYYLHHSEGTRELFRDLLTWGGVTQGIVSDDPEIKARYHGGPGGEYLWVINPTRTTRKAMITIHSRVEQIHEASDLWGGRPVTLKGNEIRVTVDQRDAAVIHLQ
jgi:beta-galactosidase